MKVKITRYSPIFNKVFNWLVRLLTYSDDGNYITLFDFTVEKVTYTTTLIITYNDNFIQHYYFNDYIIYNELLKLINSNPQE